MSTGLELIPLAIAIGVAVSRSRQTEPGVRIFQTRAKSGAMVETAFRALAADAAVHGDVLVGTIDGVPVNLRPGVEGAPWLALTPDTVDEQQAAAALDHFDREYVARVQDAVRQRVLATAAPKGLRVRDEHRESDGTVVLRLQVR